MANSGPIDPNGSHEFSTADAVAPIETSPAHERLEQGAVVAGRYQIDRPPIGRGGFGTVYRATDQTLHRDVALKVLALRRFDAAAPPDFERFLVEARTVAKLDHENIVPVYDAGVHEGKPWLTMKLIEGESLTDVIARRGRIEPDRAVRIVSAIALALAHAHRRNVLHRDVKPSNILLGRTESGEDRPWLLDFGVARALVGESTWDRRRVVGTPAYMAPEQVLGKRVDGRADQFALGCVAVELVVGARAFEGSSLSEVVARIVVGEPSGLDEVRHLGGPALAQAIQRALAKSPQDRHPDAEAFAAALRSAVAGGRAPWSWRSALDGLRRDAGSRTSVWDGRTAVQVTGLAKRYTLRRPVLADLDLRVERGTAYALLGRNGTGKTTLLRTLLGTYRADRGTVRVFGRDPWRDRRAVVARVGYVPAQLPAYEALSVGEFLRFVSRFREGWDDSYAAHLTARFELPRDGKIRSLSHGMRTKVSLLAALSHRPDLLVLDDPTVGLDAVVLSEFFDALAETTRKEGTTVLIASHNVDEVERIASHVGILSEGRVVLSSRLVDLLGSSRRVRAAFRDDVPAHAGEVGFLTSQISGRRIVGIAREDVPGVEGRLRALGAESVDLEPLTLRELFVAMMG